MEIIEVDLEDQHVLIKTTKIRGIKISSKEVNAPVTSLSLLPKLKSPSSRLHNSNSVHSSSSNHNNNRSSSAHSNNNSNNNSNSSKGRSRHQPSHHQLPHHRSRMLQ